MERQGYGKDRRTDQGTQRHWSRALRLGEKVTDPDHVTDILMGIKEDIGALTARVEEGAASRRRLEDGQQGFRDALQPVERLAISVAEMKPQVLELLQYKNRVSAYITVASIIISSTIMVIWQGLTYFSENIRARFFH